MVALVPLHSGGYRGACPWTAAWAAVTVFLPSLLAVLATSIGEAEAVEGGVAEVEL